MEKLYLVKLGNMYVTSASLTSIKLDETVEQAQLSMNGCLMLKDNTVAELMILALKQAILCLLNF